MAEIKTRNHAEQIRITSFTCIGPLTRLPLSLVHKSIFVPVLPEVGKALQASKTMYAKPKSGVVSWPTSWAQATQFLFAFAISVIACLLCSNQATWAWFQEARAAAQSWAQLATEGLSGLHSMPWACGGPLIWCRTMKVVHDKADFPTRSLLSEDFGATLASKRAETKYCLGNYQRCEVSQSPAARSEIAWIHWWGQCHPVMNRPRWPQDGAGPGARALFHSTRVFLTLRLWNTLLWKLTCYWCCCGGHRLPIFNLESFNLNGGRLGNKIVALSVRLSGSHQSGCSNLP